MLDTFLAHLHRGGAFAYCHYLPQRRSVWYTAGDALPVDPAAAKTNLYVSVHPCRGIPPANAHGEVMPPEWVRGQLSYVAAINCLYAEYDAKHYGSKDAILRHIDTMPIPPPSALVDSGGGYHGYWLLAESYLLATDAALQSARIIQDRWVGVVGGDPSVKDLTRILRVPGSRNYKYDPPPPVAWVWCDLARQYALRTLTAHLPPEKVTTVERVRAVAPIGGVRPIEAFNAAERIDALLERHGYTRAGTHRMTSPYSGSHRAGVTVDTDANRAYVHTGGDPLCDGYWKRPFDVVRILDCGGDLKRALRTIRGD